MDIYIVTSGIMDENAYANGPHPSSSPALDYLEYGHLLSLLGKGTYQNAGVNLPPSNRRTLLAPTRVVVSLLQAPRVLSRIHIACKQYDGLYLGDFEVYEYPQQTHAYKSERRSLLLMDYTDDEIYEALDRGNPICQNKSYHWIKDSYYQSSQQTTVPNSSPSNVHYVYSGAGALSTIQNVTPAPPGPAQSDDWSDPIILQNGIKIEPHNKDAYSSAPKITTTLNPPVWYKIISPDGRTLATSAIELEEKTIELFNSVVQEAYLSLYYRDSNSGEYEKFYLRPVEEDDEMHGEFWPDYQPYDINNPASLGSICRAAEYRIFQEAKRRYVPQQEEKTDAALKIDWYALAGMPAPSGQVYPIAPGSTIGGGGGFVLTPGPGTP